jgi:HEAT repeat protein
VDHQEEGRFAMIVPRRIAAATVLAMLLASHRGIGATPSGTTGQSWTDPPLGEILRTADLVAEVKVFIGGQFAAYVDVIRTFRGSVREKTVRIEGFNSYEWNTAYYSLREGESFVMALYRSGDVYCLATPSAGRFPMDNGRVIGKFGVGKFLVEIPGDDFREALTAFYRADPASAAGALGRLLQSGGIETSYFATVLQGELASMEPRAADEAVRALLGVARHDNSALREAAVASLGRIGTPTAATALAAFVTDAEWSVSLAAVRAVCKTGAAGAGRELVAWLDRAALRDRKRTRRPDTDSLKAQGEVFQFLATGDWLKEAGDNERMAVVRGMIEIVASAEPARARVAARVLGRMGAVESIPSLALMLDAEDAQLREEAAGALTAITLSPEAVSKSRFAAWWQRHKDEPRRRWIAAGLELARASLAMNTYEGDSLGRALLAIAADPAAPWIVRDRLTKGTGWRGLPVDRLEGPLIAPFVELLLTSQSSTIRAEAIASVSRIQRQYPSSRRAFLPSLISLTTDAEADVRVAALKTLEGSANRTAAGVAMQELVGGTDSSSRKAAAATLRELTGKYFGFHISRGYDLFEEEGGLDRWRTWWAATKDTLTPRPSLPRKTPAPLGGVDTLLKLASQEPADWLHAAAHLASENEGAASSLVTAARSPHGRTRAIAASIMGLRADPELGTAAIKLLDDNEPMVRLQAIWALGCCLAGTAEAPEKLIELARVEIGPADEDEPDPVPEDDFPPSMTGLEPYHDRPASTPTLSPIQAQALMALGKIGGAQAVELLGAASLSGSGDVAGCAAYSLALVQGSRADDALRTLLRKSSMSSTRDIAARTLAMRPSRETVKALIEVAAQIDRWYSYPLMNALGRIVRPHDAALVATHLDPESESASVAATYALSREPGALAIPGLVNILENGLSTPRYYAAKALQKLGERDMLPAGLRTVCSQALVLRLGDYDTTVSSAAAAALEYAGEASAGEALLRYIEQFTTPDHRAFGAVARHGGAPGQAFVFQQLTNESWSSKYFALRALRYAASQQAIEVLIKQWRDPESPYRAIAALSLAERGPRAVAELAEILRRGDAAEKRRAAILLAHFETPSANLHLRRAAASVDPDLARAAEIAIRLRRTLTARPVPLR